MRFRDVTELRIGGVTKDELRRRLARHGVQLNDYARALFADADFTTASQAHEVRLVQVSLPDLGLPNGGSFQDIRTRAAEWGLETCPLEVGPHLRLRFLEQPEGPYLTVASCRLRPGISTPAGFYLRRRADGLWLRGFVSSPDHVYPPDFTDFVFRVPGA